MFGKKAPAAGKVKMREPKASNYQNGVPLPPDPRFPMNLCVCEPGHAFHLYVYLLSNRLSIDLYRYYIGTFSESDFWS